MHWLFYGVQPRSPGRIPTLAIAAFAFLLFAAGCGREPSNAALNTESTARSNDVSDSLSRSASATPVHRSPDGEYVFPVGASVEHLEWTEYHWDGGNAVDIFAARDLKPGSQALADVHSAPVYAVADGLAFRVDNPRGGTAVLLKAETGKQFYYAHLAETRVGAELDGSSEGMPVSRGERIGSIGRSGSRTQFIEPHLHFEVIEDHEGLGWPDDTNAARWIRRTFGFRWMEENIEDYEPDRPQGFPLDSAREPVERFESMASDEPQSAGVRFDLETDTRVRSLHEGEVRVMRDTKLGLRVQVTNRPTDTTMVYSFLDTTDLETGDTVSRGRDIGVARDQLHVMFFDDGRSRDPEAIPGWKETAGNRDR